MCAGRAGAGRVGWVVRCHGGSPSWHGAPRSASVAWVVPLAHKRSCSRGKGCAGGGHARLERSLCHTAGHGVCDWAICYACAGGRHRACL